MKIDHVAIDSVTLDPANIRLQAEPSLAAIMASLQRFQQQKPVVVDEAGIVRAGNGRMYG